MPAKTKEANERPATRTKSFSKKTKPRQKKREDKPLYNIFISHRVEQDRILAKTLKDKLTLYRTMSRAG